MNKLLVGFIAGVLVTGTASKLITDTALFRLAYCNWGAVEKLWNTK